MLSANLQNFINRASDEIRKEHPDLVAHYGDFELKTLVLEHTRAQANELADTMIEIAQTTQAVKALSELLKLQ